MLKKHSLILSGLVLIAFAVPASAQFSQTERTKLVDMLSRTQSEIVSEAKGLSVEQLRFKATPERWSIAEVLEHIVLSEKFIFDTTADRVLKTTAMPERKDPKKQTENDAVILKAIPD
jgi:hypothetical protein